MIRGLRLGAAVATAALLPVMLTSVAQAAYPGRAGRIAFVKAQQIYTITRSRLPVLD